MGRITAPVGGTVVAVNVAAGGMAPSGYAVTIQSDDLQVVADFTETDLPSLALDQQATVTVSAVGASVSGVVKSIAPQAVSSSGGGVVTYAVTIALTDAPATVRVGMSAQASVRPHQPRMCSPSRASRSAAPPATTACSSLTKRGRRRPRRSLSASSPTASPRSRAASTRESASSRGRSPHTPGFDDHRHGHGRRVRWWRGPHPRRRVRRRGWRPERREPNGDRRRHGHHAMTPLAAPEPVVELDRVSRVYQLGHVQVPALREVSLTVTRGEFVAIVGASGSGKSTLMNIVGSQGLDKVPGLPVDARLDTLDQAGRGAQLRARGQPATERVRPLRASVRVLRRPHPDARLGHVLRRHRLTTPRTSGDPGSALPKRHHTEANRRTRGTRAGSSSWHDIRHRHAKLERTAAAAAVPVGVRVSVDVLSSAANGRRADVARAIRGRYGGWTALSAPVRRCWEQAVRRRLVGAATRSLWLARCECGSRS